ncbi:DUF3014 domain-containing protein [Paracidovorax wautersii]|uniref:DUF3014 domain-containing protein n=1 Tax=Paracidovorax wautersii TaxID=1177982 RepID=UPI0031DD0307
MPEREPDPYRPPTPRSAASGLLPAVLAVAIAAGAGWWFWWRPAHAPVAVPVATAPEPAAPASAPASAPAEVASGPQNPVDALAAPAPALPALADSDAYVAKSLNELLGAQKVASFLQLDGFVRRVVATVDNLGRHTAASRLWPVQPTPGRFQVEGPEEAATQTIAPANAARYGAFVSFAEALPREGVVKLYAQLYPLFQTAYEELGYPGKYFNDRLIAVLDQLITTPEPKGPLQVQLTHVQGEVPSTRPWVRYEFADPQLQALSSGQKALLRMGPDNARRLKAVLSDLRRRLAAGGAPPRAAAPAAPPVAASAAR